MTDDLNDLKRALQGAAPAPDPDRRAAALAAAMQAFDTHQVNRTQETADAMRPMSDRPAKAGFLTGVLEMLTNMTTRPALAATASVAAIAVGLGFVLTQMPQGGATLPAKAVVVADVKDANAPQMTVTADSPDVNALNKAAGAAPKQAATAQTEVRPEADVALNAEPTSPRGLTESPPQDSQIVTERLDGGALTQDMTAPPPRQQPSAAAPSPAPSGALGIEINGEAQMGQVYENEAKPEFSSRARIFFKEDGRAGLSFGDEVIAPEPNTEAFPDADANPVKIVATDPVSTFSIDVDTASYSVVRSSLMSGYLPPPDAVRIEEMVNYFPYAYPAPTAGEAPFKSTVSVIQTPWNPGTKLVHIGIQGRMPAVDDRPALNLVFLIDTSGSMEDPNKLPLLRQSFILMLNQLRPQDRVAIVTYAGSAGQVLPPTPASDRAAIQAALDNLSAGGSTAGQEGLQQAYAVAVGMAEDSEVTRVILATDGDFNVGVSDPEALKDFIAEKRKSGTYLSVLGFGRGNLDDATMQALAQNGNGTAAYIDTLSEAQKVMVDQLTGALFPIADDVKIQMEFNPAVIAEYRLIGYETRALNREDFNNDKVDAGEIGAGTSVTAIYEVTPVGSPAVTSDPLRYQASDEAAVAPVDASEIGFLKLRWKEPGASASQLIEVPVMPEPGNASADTQFAVAVAGFGQLLTGATYIGDWGWDDAIRLANEARGQDPFGYRAEAVQLMRLGESLSGN